MAVFGHIWRFLCNRFTESPVVHRESGRLRLRHCLNPKSNYRIGTRIVKDSTGQFAALDRSIADTARQTQLDAKIYTRMRELMRRNGLAYGYSEEEALEQATLEVTGAPAK